MGLNFKVEDFKLRYLDLHLKLKVYGLRPKACGLGFQLYDVRSGYWIAKRDV